MTELKFDDTKSFDDNLEAFLQHMEADDPEMGKILRDNTKHLRDAYDESARRRARTDFNTSVIIELGKKEDEDDA